MRRQPEANNGDIVLARIGPEVTLKRFARIDAEHVELQPVSTNPEHEPIRIGPTTEATEIVGIVVGAIGSATIEALEKREFVAINMVLLGIDEHERRAGPTGKQVAGIDRVIAGNDARGDLEIPPWHRSRRSRQRSRRPARFALTRSRGRERPAGVSGSA